MYGKTRVTKSSILSEAQGPMIICSIQRNGSAMMLWITNKVPIIYCLKGTTLYNDYEFLRL